jgi:flagellar biosynthetic protein FliQ
MGAADRLADRGVPMTAELLNQVSRQTFETILLVGGPTLVVSLVIGVMISLFQSITQLQEVTLTFVPKIVAVFLTLLLTLPWTIKIMVGFTHGIIANLPLYVR